MASTLAITLPPSVFSGSITRGIHFEISTGPLLHVVKPVKTKHVVTKEQLLLHYIYSPLRF